ncbi:uncharacterized protein at1g08160 [Phtheirospermum japonicum]|uniref:Uncharacterized protein at1g08160 n=1 Tax=Phtheirospermum japonicum TaxID=374723 RepID=A0A830BBS6_9LAMI|nr:uncharacterized protein at1g08160 [Phtheirospermum japonicum]
MASSSSTAAAAASANNERNRDADANPPLPAAPPPPPPPEPHAVYVQDLYRDPFRRRLFLRRRELSFLCRAVIWGLSIFLVVASLSVLMWLILHPTFPQLHVISATMSAVTTTSTAASAGCNITFLLTNPNRHLKTMYYELEISLLYPSEQVLLSQDYRPPFAQPRKSQTTIESNLSFNGDELGIDVVKAIKQDLDRGSLSLAVKILAVVSYRNGKWKTKSQFMRAFCGGVSFGFISSKKPGIFLNPYQECEVYLYTN